MNLINNEIQIYVYSMPVLDSRMYIICSPIVPNNAIIIDPFIEYNALDILHKISSATILLTHSHYDHISGVNWLREQIPEVTLLCSDECAQRIIDSNKNLASFANVLVMAKTKEEQEQSKQLFDLHYTCKADKTFHESTSFLFGDYHVTIKHTPGHSPCSQCIIFTSNKPTLTSPIIFTGDSLVNGHPVITRLPDGNKQEYQSITKPYIDSISDDTIIMPGHGDWGPKKNITTN